MDKKIDFKNKTKEISVNAWAYTKKNSVLLGFYLLAFVFFINAVMMSLHYINRNYDYTILNRLYVEAVLPDQDITNTMRTGIVKMKELDIDKLEVGDKAVICCDFGIDRKWVEDVVAINTDDEIIELTYDEVVSINVSAGDVYGVYIKEANFFGTMYYTSTFLRGYILLMLSQAIILYLYHRLFVKKVLEWLLKKEKEAISEGKS